MVDTTKISDPGFKLEDLTDYEDRCLGAVVGACVGDSMGSYCEFQSKVSNQEAEEAVAMNGGGPFQLVPGQVTDDSELAICLADGLAGGKGLFSLDRIAYFYRYWITSNPFDCGNTIRGGLYKLGQKGSGQKVEVADSKGYAKICHNSAESHNQKSESNGGLMRITPLAVFCSKLEKDEDVEKAVIAEQKMSHCNKTPIDCSISYCLAIRHLINNQGNVDGLFEKIGNWCEGRDSKVKAFWKDVIDENPPHGTPNMGWIKIAWIYSFYLLKKEMFDYKEAMRWVILKGGDTDTNAAIVGGMLGAKLGLKEFVKQNPTYFNKFLNVDMKAAKRDSFFDPKRALNLTREIVKNSQPKLYFVEEITKEEEVRKQMENEKKDE